MAKKALDYDKARELLKNALGDCSFVRRAEAVAEFAYELALKIRENKKMNIDPERVKIAALLHDIGKKDKDDYDKHPFTGAKMLYEMGHEDIARIIETHGDAVEVAKLYKIRGSYHPKTVEQKIVTYADFRIDLSGKKVTLETRLKELKKDALAKMDISRIKRYEETEKRLKKIDQDVKAMLKPKK